MGTVDTRISTGGKTQWRKWKFDITVLVEINYKEISTALNSVCLLWDTALVDINVIFTGSRFELWICVTNCRVIKVFRSQQHMEAEVFWEMVTYIVGPVLSPCRGNLYGSDPHFIIQNFEKYGQILVCFLQRKQIWSWVDISSTSDPGMWVL
jgi:hypothetical protein